MRALIRTVVMPRHLATTKSMSHNSASITKSILCFFIQKGSKTSKGKYLASSPIPKAAVYPVWVVALTLILHPSLSLRGLRALTSPKEHPCIHTSPCAKGGFFHNQNRAGILCRCLGFLEKKSKKGSANTCSSASTP